MGKLYKKTSAVFVLAFLAIAPLALLSAARTADGFMPLSATISSSLQTIREKLDLLLIEELKKQRDVLQTQMQEVKENLARRLQDIPALTRGVQGKEVENLQQVLVKYPGIYPERLVTGYFGPRTEAAVKKLRSVFGLPATGAGTFDSHLKSVVAAILELSSAASQEFQLSTGATSTVAQAASASASATSTVATATTTQVSTGSTSAVSDTETASGSGTSGGTLTSTTVTPPATVYEGPSLFFLPSGKQTYKISSKSNSPVFTEAVIDPTDVHVGQTQIMTVKANDTDPIGSVTAAVETDNGTNTYALSRIDGTTTDGTWQGSWVVSDTHSRTYRTVFTATNSKGESVSVTLTWSDPCAPSAGGNWTLDGNCSHSGVGGVDNGNVNIASGYTLTIQSGAIFAFNPGQSISISGGSIALGSGGEIRKTYLWMTDADSDGYPNSTTQTAQDTSPGANYRRRNVLSSVTSTDVDDANANTFQSVGSLIADSDQDGYTTGSSGTQNVGGSTTVSGRTYYKNSSGSYAWLVASQAVGSSDCNDSDVARWRNRYADGDGDTYGAGALVCVGNHAGYVDNASDCNDADGTRWRNRYADSDGDSYGASSATCVGNHAGYVDNSSDCYDSNANAKPGQTTYYNVHRGDGNFDYNCDGSASKDPTYDCTRVLVSCSNPSGASVHAGYVSGSPSCGVEASFSLAEKFDCAQVEPSQGNVSTTCTQVVTCTAGWRCEANPGVHTMECR